MKSKSMQSKAKRIEATVATDSTVQQPKRDEVPTRTIYVRDDGQTRTGFASHKAAVDHADTLVKPDKHGSRDSEAMRVRVSFRRRTGLYDVVVKLAKKVPVEQPKAIGE